MVEKSGKKSRPRRSSSAASSVKSTTLVRTSSRKGGHRDRSATAKGKYVRRDSIDQYHDKQWYGSVPVLNWVMRRRRRRRLAAVVCAAGALYLFLRMRARNIAINAAVWHIKNKLKDSIKSLRVE